MSLIEKLKAKKAERTIKENFYLSWRPNEGEIIEGVVKDLGKTITDFGEQNYLTLETTDGKVFTVWLNKILQEQAEKEGVQVGDKIALNIWEKSKAQKIKRKSLRTTFL